MPEIPLIAVRNVVKDYHALRPLRLQELTVDAGDIVTLLGLDAQAAEMLVALLTAAVLPDAGEVRLLGQSTADVPDSTAWLAMLDAIGIVTDRAVLIDQFSVQQNIAMPFTLEVDPVPPAIGLRVDALAREVGLPASTLSMPVGTAEPEVRVRVRIARAVALYPRIVLAEHPTASLPRDAVERIARDLGHLARSRGLAVLTMTADQAFARALGGEVLTHEPATGALRPSGLWRKLFG